MRIKITHKFRTLPGIVLDSNKCILSLPYTNKGRSHPLRRLIAKKHQGKLKYLIKNKRYTSEQLESLAIKESGVIETGILNTKNYE